MIYSFGSELTCSQQQKTRELHTFRKQKTHCCSRFLQSKLLRCRPAVRLNDGINMICATAWCEYSAFREPPSRSSCWLALHSPDTRMMDDDDKWCCRVLRMQDLSRHISAYAISDTNDKRNSHPQKTRLNSLPHRTTHEVSPRNSARSSVVSLWHWRPHIELLLNWLTCWPKRKFNFKVFLSTPQ